MTSIRDWPQLLSRKEAAQYLSVRPQTLACWATEGRGPRMIRYSARCIRYRVEDLKAWLDEQETIGGNA
ncbi:MAG: helix-turn-helix domain-containing protein [Planctomycetes bacterium]|nr:helix-turn-helix domain-containing protein [Planctomycetota bacterium]